MNPEPKVCGICKKTYTNPGGCVVSKHGLIDVCGIDCFAEAHAMTDAVGLATTLGDLEKKTFDPSHRN